MARKNVFCFDSLKNERMRKRETEKAVVVSRKDEKYESERDEVK